MMKRTAWGLMAALLIAFAGLSPLEARAQNRAGLLGGPTGSVRSDKGVALEGMMVQLISGKTAIRTTVYSHADGRYEFPKLEAGSYVLRIATPLEFRPYVKESVRIDGPTKLDDIVLRRVSETALLPPYPEIAGQLSGAEWLMSLSGTADEKKLLTVNCNWCHSYQQIFRNRYDEEGWRKVVYRMTHGAGSTLINVNPTGRFPDRDEARLVKWLATVRSPQSKDPPLFTFPRPKGRSTNAVITEYELPRLELATHDVAGDANGNLWYSVHRSSYIGRLDPRTGKVKEYHVPLSPGAAPGTHWLYPDPQGNIWASENWAHNMIRLNPQTGEIKKIPWYATSPLNSSMGGNFAMDPQGFIWECRDGAVLKFDANTGAIVKKYPTKRFRSTYGAAVSKDGRYFAGGAWEEDGIVVVDTKTGEVFEPETSPTSGPARGSFDLQGNYWSGGRSGVLVKFDTSKHTIQEYPVPTPYGSLYTAKADKNGEIWTGELHTGRYLRFNPKTEQWTEYLLPEPYGHDRESWIDNSTDPVSVWYVDHEGYLVRIQPLE